METEDRFGTWQRAWRELLGEPPTPRSWRDDFDLHFALGSDKPLRDALLRVMPRGDELVPRVDAVVAARDARQPAPDDATLISLGQHAIAACNTLAPFDADRPYGIPGHMPRLGPPRRVRVERGGDAERSAAFKGRGLVVETVCDVMSSVPEAAEDSDAMRFLREPVYQMTTYFEPRVWVLWPYVQDVWGRSCALDSVFELWRHGAQVFVGSDDAVVFVLERG